MALYTASLNSGSNGNCYYIGNDEDAVLIDAGISCREIEKRMLRLGLPMERVRAIVVSHEHSDHIRGIPVLARKYSLPVYISGRTLQHCGFEIERHLLRDLHPGPLSVGSLQIDTFSKFHDASEPYSFVVSYAGVRIGVFTDIGRICQQVITYFRNCQAVFLEANYDTDMLDRGRYPYFLKNRIRGGMGHLSNQQALELFTAHRSAHLSHLLLSHLSKDNNCPDLVQSLFSSCAGDTAIVVASRDRESELFCIEAQKKPLRFMEELF